LNEYIPPVAAKAWQAYNAMEATKQRHFAYMSGLENHYRKYGSPSEAEKQMLARLLKEHDAQVSAFKAAIQELRALDRTAHDDLLDYIARLHAAMTPFLRDA
jgi:hypothetical protein